MAESGSLENCCAGNGTEGSNPSTSEKKYNQNSMKGKTIENCFKIPEGKPKLSKEIFFERWSRESFL